MCFQNALLTVVNVYAKLVLSPDSATSECEGGMEGNIVSVMELATAGLKKIVDSSTASAKIYSNEGLFSAYNIINGKSA